MRILIANYRYFISSGPERYLFNVTSELEKRGHEILPFSVRYQQNLPSPYDKFFVTPIAGEEEIYFDQHKRSIKSTAKGLSRLFYSSEVENSIDRMISETRPDIAYVLYYLRKMSPSLLVGIKKHKIPLVVRISDYGMMCGEHHMLKDDSICTDCVDSGSFNQVKNRCIKKSLSISLLDYIATEFHRKKKYFDLIDQFVTTNEFMTEMMMKSGVSPSRITCIPTFTNTEMFSPAPTPPVSDPYLIYVGRLDRPKGVHILLKAIENLSGIDGMSVPRLVIVGAGHSADYVDMLKDQASKIAPSGKIEFCDTVKPTEIPALLKNAYAAIMPALWFENLPNSVIEAFACGVPVIASDLGSLRYTVEHEYNGLRFPAGDDKALAKSIVRIISDNNLRDNLRKNARNSAMNIYSSNNHVEKLMALFSNFSKVVA